MRLVLVSAFCFFSFSLLSQRNTLKNGSKISIGVETGIFNAQAKIGRTKPNTPTPRLSYYFRSNIFYKIPSSRISFFTGIGYRKIQQILRERDIKIFYSEDFSDEIDSENNIITNYNNSFYSSGFDNIDLAIKIKATQFNPGNDLLENERIEIKMDYASEIYIESIVIPLGIQYNISKKKNVFFAKSAVLINFMKDYNFSKHQLNLEGSVINLKIGYKKISIENISAKRNLENFKKIVSEFLIGGGIESQIAPRLSIYGSIQYTLPLSPFYSDGNISTSFNTIGISVGTRFLL